MVVETKSLLQGVKDVLATTLLNSTEHIINGMSYYAIKNYNFCFNEFSIKI